MYINPKLIGGFNDFIIRILAELRTEMNRVSQAFYQTRVTGQELFGVDNLFSVIERTWVGIFNNALVRNSDIAVMQEFSVWSDEKNIGRCDLLFRFNDGNEEIDIVAEAKCYEFFNNWDKFNNAEFYKRILDQAYRYYKEERNYYEKKVKLMAIVFEWIRNNDRLEAAKKLMDEFQHRNDPETDFLSLYYGNSRGVFVYGKILSVDDYEKIQADK